MYIGELKNKEMQTYRKRGKIESLRAAKEKAAYLESLGKQLSDVIRIVEPQESINYYTLSVQSNMNFISSPILRLVLHHQTTLFDDRPVRY
ncbi:hypothetical protein [uncultured Coprobacter sp.]|uniref:hypothetical protein n=1 Tax=Coprobacter sp. TaxID=1941478 RepID=UPI00261CF4D9|nr:hypothetical protein [uncultured Coprobacter sp.]MBS6267581.1 hypothetical protein [Tannerella sp.]